MISKDLQSAKVFVAVGNTDMRKSINGLSLLVEEHFKENIFSGNLFVFCNRRRDMVKILYWSDNGFCVWLKRLEKDFFRWPESLEDVHQISYSALEWLLQGLDMSQAHGRLFLESAG